jgi:hypothetical protein
MKHLEFNKRFDELRTLVPVDRDQRHKLKLTDLKKGSFIMFNGSVCKVVDEYTYRYKKEKWGELQLMSVDDEKIFYLEIEEDDVVEVFLTDKEIKLRDINISKSDIDDIVDEEEAIKYNGVKYWYEDDYKVGFSRVGDTDEENCYLYEFESENDEYLTIEKWDNSYEVFISRQIDPKAIEIISI